MHSNGKRNFIRGEVKKGVPAGGGRGAGVRKGMAWERIQWGPSRVGVVLWQGQLNEKAVRAHGEEKKKLRGQNDCTREE